MSSLKSIRGYISKEFSYYPNRDGRDRDVKIFLGVIELGFLARVL